MSPRAKKVMSWAARIGSIIVGMLFLMMNNVSAQYTGEFNPLLLGLGAIFFTLGFYPPAKMMKDYRTYKKKAEEARAKKRGE